MTRLVAVLRAIWEFIVGDDPLSAAGVVIALGLVALIGSSGWWVLPVAAALLLARAVLAARR